MQEPDYSNREIDRMFSEIMTALNRIEAQTTKTNGRVTKIELEREKEKGILTAYVSVISVVIGLAVSWVKNLIT